MGANVRSRVHIARPVESHARTRCPIVLGQVCARDSLCSHTLSAARPPLDCLPAGGGAKQRRQPPASVHRAMRPATRLRTGAKGRRAGGEGGRPGGRGARINNETRHATRGQFTMFTRLCFPLWLSLWLSLPFGWREARQRARKRERVTERQRERLT